MKVKKKARERQPPLSIQVEIGRQAFYRGKLNNPFRPKYRTTYDSFSTGCFLCVESLTFILSITFSYDPLWSV